MRDEGAVGPTTTTRPQMQQLTCMLSFAIVIVIDDTKCLLVCNLLKVWQFPAIVLETTT